MLRKICLALMFAFVANCAYADATVLGLKMGEATIADVKAKYSVRANGINSWTKGEMYQISTSDIPIDDLKSATAIFDANGKLVCVGLVMSKGGFNSRFKEMHEQLKKKYKVVKTKIPHVGDTYAHYKDGKTVIELDAPHMSFDMTLTYMQQSFKQAVDSGVEQEQKAKKQQEADML